MSTRRHTLRAMGTEVSLVADDEVDPDVFRRAAEAVEAVFAREEDRFSRFRPWTELARVNAQAGRWVRVSGPFAALVRYSLHAARETGGLFDPTVLPALEAAGYDRDFDEVLAGARGALHPPKPCGRWREVELRGRMLRLPAGVGLDFGGVAKGWAVDLAAEAAVDAGLPWAVVNAGGDLRIAGEAPEGGLDITVEEPERPDDEAVRLRLAAGALATSSVTRRAWGPELHHLIDPRSGAPAATEVLQATVWAPTCAEAEIRSKQALLEGPGALERLPGVLVLREGPVLISLAQADGPNEAVA